MAAETYIRVPRRTKKMGWFEAIQRFIALGGDVENFQKLVFSFAGFLRALGFVGLAGVVGDDSLFWVPGVNAITTFDNLALIVLAPYGIYAVVRIVQIRKLANMGYIPEPVRQPVRARTRR